MYQGTPGWGSCSFPEHGNRGHRGAPVTAIKGTLTNPDCCEGTVMLSHQSGNPGTVWRLTARPFRPSRQLLFTAQRNKCFPLLGCALLSPTQVRTARSPQRGFWEMRLLLTPDPCEVHDMLSLLRPLGEPLATRGHWALQIWLVPLRDWIPN